MTYTLTGLTSMGNITSEESTKDSQLFQMPIPLSDSSSAVMLDLFGASRTITVKGRYTTADGTISAFIAELDALVNGTQTTKVYHSDKTGGNYNVLVQSIRWSGEEAGINFVDYEIVLTEGSA
jgi:hypothetical protein